MLTFNELINAERGAAAELARNLGVSEAAVSRWASGSARPGVRAAAKIGTVTNTRPVIQPDGTILFEPLKKGVKK
jgi:transcriptional regulator with XRE-family HTH domain